MIDNPNDARIDDIYERLRALESGAPLGYSSISRGSLRVASEEGLVVQGSALVTGIFRTVGRIVLEGLGILTVNGLIELFGNLLVKAGGYIDIAGGKLIAANVRIEGGRIHVGSSDQIVLDGGSGKITAGNVTVEPNKVTVGGGSSPATLQDGAMSFGTGGRVEADTSVGGAKLEAGDAVVNVGDVASVRKGSSSVIVGGDSITINAGGEGTIQMLDAVQFSIGSIPTVSGTGLPLNALIITSGGYLRRSDGLG